MTTRFATLVFDRESAAPPAALWRAWTDPQARAIWSAPSPAVTVEYLKAESVIGGEEVSICRAEGQPDIRCAFRWLTMEPARRSTNTEILSAGGTTLSAALVTAEIAAHGDGAALRLTVQLTSLAEDMEQGYVQGFAAGLDNLVDVAQRTMVLDRVIAAPIEALWQAWTDPQALPEWWGPDGFSCRTRRIDLREGGEWVFDMIAPDGTVFPNHHKYSLHDWPRRIDYTLHWGEDGPKHADASVTFTPEGSGTRVMLGMIFASREECEGAKAMGAVALGQQTLGKLARYVGA
ncbi:ATPase [Pararhodobacter marinus]|uniref:ATPase n=1 Tax=Pararhodobacter marinus TaxID=2184063 RepID=A0A2U2C6G3_9RHOB|nr:SRPBCC domain-containing protein [Pararhodobacter marinus]PWE27384.1 ATPase [Pararhodobacter marinus]